MNLNNRLFEGEHLMTVAARDALDDKIISQAREINRLRAEIRQLGEMADVCTFNALGEICEGCRCEKRANIK